VSDYELASPRSAGPTITRWATAVVGLVLLAIVVAADRAALPRPVQRLYAFPGGDKVGHAVLVGGLTFVAGLGFTSRTRPAAGVRVPVSPLIIAVLVTVEEATQAWFPSRTLSVLDLLASYAGILLGAGAAHLVRRDRALGTRREAYR